MAIQFNHPAHSHSQGVKYRHCVTVKQKIPFSFCAIETLSERLLQCNLSLSGDVKSDSFHEEVIKGGWVKQTQGLSPWRPRFLPHVNRNRCVDLFMSQHIYLNQNHAFFLLNHIFSLPNFPE